MPQELKDDLLHGSVILQTPFYLQILVNFYILYYMTAQELREKYLNFFKSKGHTILPSASLIPENDPTVLFTTAGMHPLVPYLMGENHPGGKRVASAQKCIRTVDIDEVGDTTHHTLFEMLGNWSFGDYFKKESIEWSWELLTSSEWLNLDKKRLAVSVFAGDDDAPRDDDAAQIWLKVSGEELDGRIDYLPKNKNWWGPAGETGPCGPDTEIFYWVGEDAPPKKITPGDLSDHPKWVEIWNNVFMQYNKTADAKFELLKQQNVDTGMGLDRVLAIINNESDNYKTSLFSNLINKIEYLSGKKYGESDEITKAMRVIADHIKAAVFIIGDDKGITPSNTDQGYIVRRLLRRAIRYGRQLGIKEESWTKEVAKIVVHDYAQAYPELRKNVDFIIDNIKEEEEKFEKTLERGLKEFEKMANDNKISGEEAFDLYQTYGFPLEITKELSVEKGIKIDEEGFKKELEKHQELSRTASAGKFKGGLADASEETKRLHTAAHLLLAALRKVLGEHVMQKGSNITGERLRFDFSHGEKMTDEQKTEVERLVNEAIKNDLKVNCEEMDLGKAKEQKAMGVFESKYGERVKVYTIGKGEDILSKEICGGPHVEKTGILGSFKIKKEESSSAGVRRIKAILS
jgi:alanyl-tRNA synthetase